MESVANTVHREPWNKGKIVGQKAPFKPKDIWALRVRLQMERAHRAPEQDGLQLVLWRLPSAVARQKALVAT